MRTFADVPPSIASRERDRLALGSPTFTELEYHIRLLEMWRSRARKIGATETHVHISEHFAALEIHFA